MSDEEDFRQFAASRQKQLLRSAYLLCGDWHGAEDLVQTAFGQLYRSWHRVRRVEHPDAYAKQVLYRCHLSAKRKRRFTTVSIDSVLEPAASGDGFGDGSTGVLLEALAGLPDRARAVVVLRFWEDYSVAQTAEALGVSQGTVKSQSSRALALLRERIGDSFSDIGQD
ncbi:RNA polymerase, sigma-24 subunit, ECF subfamily [Catenulispora acidiphila DSM 44928]|uniref:RNA polymerase, sigma-24 subunit, ECF subfamily n=1 Tax=Catenulispora acidiphila (strain DSM 44928 / JCM 14897 / NBRC 102108 / NRRL B-24433 / ID139908) TaxID=479433 RepID=C7Q451_CATAD|nr:SigE family RNA polymerase sigma factor [Catenulispora acidiphila]ACU69911.1 RNA polymerase, sigma-24 subunit, ECF subfamily [Catenulispora acidiphila DSM 44928]